MKRLFFVQLMVLGLAGYGTAQTNPGLDPTFGNGDGYVVTMVGTEEFNGTLSHVLVQPDGKIIAAGYYGIVRYHPDGSIDNGFANNGLFLQDFNHSSSNMNMQLQPDGKILVLKANFYMRLNSNGTLDASFGHNGYSDTVSDLDLYTHFVLQPDGKVMMAGSYDHFMIIDGTSYTIAQAMLVRFTPEGIIDSSFAEDGRLSVTAPNETVVDGNTLSVDGILTDNEGRLIIGGNFSDVWGSNGIGWYAARLLPDGSLDTTFNHTGIASTAGLDFTKDMALQADGKVVLLGNNLFDDPAPFILLRYNTDGSLDTEFGEGGIAVLPWDAGGGNKPSGIAIQPNGRIIVCGWAWSVEDSLYEHALIACSAGGQLDSSFANGGRIISHIRNGNGAFSSIAIQQDSKIVAVGGSDNTGYPNTGIAVVARYLSDTNVSIPGTEIDYNQITAYPNPANDMLHINNQTNYPVSQITIYDISGRKLVVSMGDQPVTITHLPAGLYFLLVSADNGKIIVPISFIIHH